MKCAEISKVELENFQALYPDWYSVLLRFDVDMKNDMLGQLRYIKSNYNIEELLNTYQA